MSDQSPVETPKDPVDLKDGEQKKDFVSLETHRRLLDEKKRAQAQLEQLLAEKKARDEEEARKRGDFQKIEEGLKSDLESERQKRKQLEEMFEHGRKLNAVTEALGTIESKWLKLLDVSQVAVHPETGEVDMNSVAKVAEAFKKEFPEAMRKPANMPSAQPAGLSQGSGRILESEWKRLPTLKEMNKWRRDQIVWGQ